MATPANRPSADTAIQTAPGNSAAKGTARRAAASAPSSRTVTGTATLAADPTTMQSAPAQKPPLSPIRASAQNSSVASGGMRGNVSRPHHSAVDSGSERDEVSKGGEKAAWVSDPRQVVQVLVWIQQHLHPASLQPVHQD